MFDKPFERLYPQRINAHGPLSGRLHEEGGIPGLHSRFAGPERGKRAGHEETTVAPSPRFWPTIVSSNGRPFCAPRGCNSVIAGGAAAKAVARQRRG
jgi:hypothetical protein